MSPQHWLELYPLHGTCPLCSTPNLLLDDDIWIPPHTPAHPLTALAALRWLAPNRSDLNPDQCPIGRHTQAVEDGGVEVELQWLDLLLTALIKQHAAQDPCPHPQTAECIQSCPKCSQHAEHLRMHTDVYHKIVRRWSRPNPAKEVLPIGVGSWRDREPIPVVSLGRCPRGYYDEWVSRQQDVTPPFDVTLAYMTKVLREGVHRPADKEDSVRLHHLRRYGLARKARKGLYQLTPLGHFLIGKYHKSHAAVAAMINTFRFTHQHFDPILSA